jgi:AGZA family xanthine/uracil permease-like MFS transporter
MLNLLDRIFHLNEKGTSIKIECLAALTTFSTMAYIIVVNPLVLAATGMDFGAVMVATIVAASLSTLIMGLYANYPFAQAPGMGLNAYFTYAVVLGMGHTWQDALGASFLAGVALLTLNILGVREWIMNAIPSCLRLSATAGMGLFLAFIGLKNVGIIVDHPSTLVSLGDVTSPTTYMSGIGLVITAALLVRQVKGAIFLGILFNWLVGLASGLVAWQGVFSFPPSPFPTFFQLNWEGALHYDMLAVVLSFLFIIIFDTAGTLMGLAEQGHFLDKMGHLPRARKALVSDTIGTSVGALMGTSPMTTYLESSAGIAAGGKTGLTAVLVALLFLSCLFLSPLVASIPLFATTPALILIGAYMLTALRALNWDDASEIFPAFIVLVTIPLTFSIATGIGLGFISYALIKLFSGKKKQVHGLIWVLALLFAVKFALS